MVIAGPKFPWVMMMREGLFKQEKAPMVVSKREICFIPGRSVVRQKKPVPTKSGPNPKPWNKAPKD